MNKYISTKDAVRLTGLSRNEIYALIHNGKLPARKAPKSGWRISPNALFYLGLIKEEPNTIFEEHQSESHIINEVNEADFASHQSNKSNEERVKPKVLPRHATSVKRHSPKSNLIAMSEVYYVEDEEHYTEVFKRMAEVNNSLKIATGDLKNFTITFESDNGEETLRICDFFMSLVERGVHVQVMCMKPFFFYIFTKENCPKLLEHPLFELRYNGHNHMKVFIFDDVCAYIGSANITSAAIGKRKSGKRNHEAGLLLSGESMIQSPLRHFEKAWNDPDVLKHTWKRFVTMARNIEKEKGRR